MYPGSMSLFYLLFVSFKVLNTHLILIFAAYQIGTVSIHHEVFRPVPNLNLLGMQKALSYFSSESELPTEMVDSIIVITTGHFFIIRLLAFLKKSCVNCLVT